VDIATTAAVQTNLLLLHLAYAEWPVAWKVAGPGGKGERIRYRCKSKFCDVKYWLRNFRGIFVHKKYFYLCIKVRIAMFGRKYLWNFDHQSRHIFTLYRTLSKYSKIPPFFQCDSLKNATFNKNQPFRCPMYKMCKWLVSKIPYGRYFRGSMDRCSIVCVACVR